MVNSVTYQIAIVSQHMRQGHCISVDESKPNISPVHTKNSTIGIFQLSKLTATQSSMIPLSVKWLKEHFFTIFSHIFLKGNHFVGVPVMEFFEFLVPKVQLGLKNMWKK